VSLREMAFASLLMVAGFWAFISALMLMGAVYEGDKRASRGWAASFVGSSLVAACAFWGLL
jgi:hypothetical protein